MSIRDGFNIDSNITLDNINIVYNKIKQTKLLIKNINQLTAFDKFKLFFVCLGIFMIIIVTPLLYYINVRPDSILFCFVLGIIDLITSQIISSDYLRTESKVDMDF